jgi:phosphopantetheinyl transferase
MSAPTIRFWTVDLEAVRPRATATIKGSTGRREARQGALEQVAELAGVDVVKFCLVCGEHGHGRPVALGEGVDVSITWVGRWGLVAFADCRLGIDAELRRVAPNPVTSALAPSEVAGLASLSGRDRAESFLRLWTAKEAVAKADGRGLTLPLAQLDVAPVIAHGEATVPVDGVNWHVAVLHHEFPDGEPAELAIATDCKTRRIICSPMSGS